MISLTMTFLLATLGQIGDVPSGLLARRDRAESELRGAARALGELTSIKSVMLRLLNKGDDLQEMFGLAQKELIEAKPLDDGGHDVFVLPAYYIKLDPIRIRVLALPGGHRFSIQATWQEPTQRRQIHDLNLDLDTSSRQTRVDGREFRPLSGHDFRVVFPSRVNLFITWAEGREVVEAVVVDGFARHRITCRGGEGPGAIESRELISERVEVPPPSVPGWVGVASGIRGPVGDPLDRPVVIPLFDGSPIVRPLASAFSDDPKLGLQAEDRALLREMGIWGRNLPCAGDEAQAALFVALAGLESVDDRISRLNGRSTIEERQSLARDRNAAADRVSEASRRVDPQARKTIETVDRLNAETRAIRRDMTKYVQTSWLSRSAEFDALVGEARSIQGGKK